MRGFGECQRVHLEDDDFSIVRPDSDAHRLESRGAGRISALHHGSSQIVRQSDGRYEVVSITLFLTD